LARTRLVLFAANSLPACYDIFKVNAKLVCRVKV